MLSIKLDKKTEDLRKEFAFWLKSQKIPQLPAKCSLDQYVEITTLWQKNLAKNNWIAVHWPIEFGGRGVSLVQEAVIQEELAKVQAPQPINLFGLTMVGPVLIEHGTAEQKERFLKKILNAEEIWCQGFSEPTAGSDLASLKTTAELNADNWIINGRKIWTSFAQYADWCFVLVRTNKEVPKHKGLSYLLVPMKQQGIKQQEIKQQEIKQQGIEIQSLKQISGDEEFNEVLFEDVKTSKDNIIGKEGDGWKIAISTLMHERVILTFARHLQSEKALADISLILKLDKSEKNKIRFGEITAKNIAMRALALNHLSQYQNKNPGPEGSLDKLIWSENFQKIVSFNLELLGLSSVIESGESSYLEGSFVHRYLYSRGRTIAAGTSEVQRNIIAERVLGLPKS